MGKLINISEAANLAIHSMAMIAASDKPINAVQIATSLGVSRNHLSKVLQTLTRYNYLTSTRGPRGGFKLLRDAGEITFLEIYEIIDGTIEPIQCFHLDNLCPFAECVYGDEKERLVEQFRNFYGSRRFDDVKMKNC